MRLQMIILDTGVKLQHDILLFLTEELQHILKNQPAAVIF